MRAKRRFEERKRKLKRLDEVYDWGHVTWDGKHLYRNWQHYWWFRHKEKPIKWWGIIRMSESGHSAWVHTFMTKPHRAEASRLTRSITAGRIEADAAIFPVHGKPWIYYW